MKRHHDKNSQLFDPINQGSAKEVDVYVKGQLFSICLFGVLNCLQKMNENKSTGCFIVRKLNLFVVFGRNVGLKKILLGLSDL